MKRRSRCGRFRESMAEEDPLGLMPSLFDLSIVLALAFLLTALGALNLSGLMRDEDWMLIRRDAAGQTEVISREGRSLRVQQLSPRQAGGQGLRLGVAYELDNGEVIYVPD